MGPTGPAPRINVVLAQALKDSKARGWMDAAQCRGSDPNEWHPVGGPGHSTEELEEAKKADCIGCVVVAECREYALTSPRQDEGVWGGTSAKDRRRIVKARRAAAREAARAATQAAREAAAREAVQAPTELEVAS